MFGPWPRDFGSRENIHHHRLGRGPAGARPESGNRFLYGFYLVGRLLRPPRRGAAAGGTVLPDKNHIEIDSRTPAGPRPDPGHSDGGVYYNKAVFEKILPLVDLFAEHRQAWDRLGGSSSGWAREAWQGPLL